MSDLPLIPLSCLCLCIHVFLVFYPANTMRIYSYSIRFAVLTSSIYLRQQLPWSRWCCEQELQATGFRIDQQMRDAKLLGLTQVGSRAREFFDSDFFVVGDVRSEKIAPSQKISKIKDDRYMTVG